MKCHLLLLLTGCLPLAAAPERDVRAELERAGRFGHEMAGLMANHELRMFWPRESGSALIYRVNPAVGEHRFFRVDPATGIKAPAFDHEALAKSLAAAVGRNVSDGDLPLDGPGYGADPESVRFRAFGKGWLYQAGKLRPDEVAAVPATLLPPREVLRGTRDSGPATSLTIENTRRDEIEIFWIEGRGKRKSYGRIPAGEQRTIGTYTGHRWLFTDAKGKPLGGIAAGPGATLARVDEAVADPSRRDPQLSPDGKWRAEIRDHNVVVTPTAGGEAVVLTEDGSPEDGYDGPFRWSPDGRHLVAWRGKAVEVRKIPIIQSSPPDQVQPKLQMLDYAKPGDPIRQPKPRLFDLTAKRQVPLDDALFANPWDIGQLEWSPDGAEFSFLYNQRGHQVMRVVAVCGDTGKARTVHEERSSTFIDYSQKTWLHRLPQHQRILWASERSGYNHIYQIDAARGTILNAVTQGEWNVREVVKVDEAAGNLLLRINGQPGSDPYYDHFARVNFDGSGFTRLTGSDGNHRVEFSPDGRWLIDTWSRVDQAPVVELRRASDGHLVTELARADDSALLKRGWQRPERFVAKGRDGKTDIYGIIVRPPHFDPARKYPVLEHIYAGPHSFFTPKNFFTRSLLTEMAGLGFVVVQLDGMGTNWRGKAFHDVCWKNLMDSGFPDRIAWHRAAAATRPWLELSRMGLFGGSAGGQSTLAGMLNHGDFYQAGVADCGCHDNRMDKIWWNEAWMGWPVDDSYASNSNVTHAAKLRGKLMLVVGELDHNVDPASTMQVVGALQRAGKAFDFVPVGNAGHGAAETPYGKFRRATFLVEHLRPAPVAW
jgi:dipeptidyl aminopeptidase/acylaminoacyl peptidase